MQSKTTDSQKTASILLDIGSVLFSRRHPFKFDSGILSPVYVDNRLLISYPKERNQILDMLVKKIKEIGMPDVVAGVATAGIPHTAFLAQKLNIPMVFVRSKPKDHGRGNQVEGIIKKGQKVLVVEDLVSTGGSSASVVEALRNLGAEVTGVLAIYSHNLKAADQNFKEANVKFTFLTNTQEVAKVAKEKGLLQPGQIETIIEWTKDPKNWGKKMEFE